MEGGSRWRTRLKWRDQRDTIKTTQRGHTGFGGSAGGSAGLAGLAYNGGSREKWSCMASIKSKRLQLWSE